MRWNTDKWSELKAVVLANWKNQIFNAVKKSTTLSIQCSNNKENFLWVLEKKTNHVCTFWGSMVLRMTNVKTWKNTRNLDSKHTEANTPWDSFSTKATCTRSSCQFRNCWENSARTMNHGSKRLLFSSSTNKPLSAQTTVKGVNFFKENCQSKDFCPNFLFLSSSGSQDSKPLDQIFHFKLDESVEKNGRSGLTPCHRKKNQYFPQNLVWCLETW